MSQRSRQRLAMDAEKLYACYQLWIKHNDLLASVDFTSRCVVRNLICLLAISGGRFHSVLSEAVYAYMTECGEGHHEDIMRAFFRLRVGDIGSLLPKVVDTTMKHQKGSSLSTSNILIEANNVLLVSTLPRM
jgi:nuclear pore complex protein Nup133